MGIRSAISPRLSRSGCPRLRSAWARMPARAPELNPVENVAVHAGELAVEPGLHPLKDILDHCCEAWNKLADQPWTMSIGLRAWFNA